MSAGRRPHPDAADRDPGPVPHAEWVPLPVVIDAEGERLATLRDDRGRSVTRPVAELVLEAFVGPRPPGHVVRFLVGNRLNCAVENLEWAPAAADPAAQAAARATRKRADAMRRRLAGRPQSDSAELVAEDRLR